LQICSHAAVQNGCFVSTRFFWDGENDWRLVGGIQLHKIGILVIVINSDEN